MDVKKILLWLLQEEQIADHKKKEKLDKQHRILLKFVILDFQKILNDNYFDLLRDIFLSLINNDLKIPENFGTTIQENKSSNPHGDINFFHGQKQFLSKGTHSKKPKKGDFRTTRSKNSESRTSRQLCYPDFFRWPTWYWNLFLEIPLHPWNWKRSPMEFLFKNFRT